MISLKMGLVMAAMFAAGSFLAPPVQQAIAAVIATDVQCTGCVGPSDLAGNSVTSAKIKDGEVKAADLGSNSVNSGKIADGTIAYGDVSRNLIAVEHRDDCNCGGTGWDPNGSDAGGHIYDDRITLNSVVSTSFASSYRGAFIHCETYVVASGHAVVACDKVVPPGAGINYAIFSNPAYS
jgi:hypothetical protein